MKKATKRGRTVTKGVNQEGNNEARKEGRKKDLEVDKESNTKTTLALELAFGVNLIRRIGHAALRSRQGLQTHG